MRAEREAREAAEREAASEQRACELLRQAAGGDDSFEAAMAQELSAMRDAYEAKLRVAADRERDAAVAHRKELKAMQAEHERELHAMEARVARAAALGPAANRPASRGGAALGR